MTDFQPQPDSLPLTPVDRAARVKLVILDVDGVLSDGGLYYGPDGEIVKRFNALDGHGLKMLRASGVLTAIISARASTMVLRRAADLGIDHVQQDVHDKRQAFELLTQKLGVAAECCGFVGDDVIDLPVLTRVGFAVSVANGHAEVRARAHYITYANGGHGAVREVCDFILRAQNNYDAALAPYLT